MKTKTFVILACLLLALPAFSSAEPAVVKLGDVTSYTGDVLVRTKGIWKRLKAVPHPVFSSDKVVTKRGRAEIAFVDGGILKINLDSNLSVVEKKEAEGWAIR